MNGHVTGRASPIHVGRRTPGVEHRDPRRPQAPRLRLATHHRGHRAPAAVKLSLLAGMRLLSYLSLCAPSHDRLVLRRLRPDRLLYLPDQAIETPVEIRRPPPPRPRRASARGRDEKEGEDTRPPSRRVADHGRAPQALAGRRLVLPLSRVPRAARADATRRASRPAPSRRAQHAAQAAEGREPGLSRRACSTPRARPSATSCIAEYKANRAADARRPARAGRSRCTRRSPRSAGRCCASTASRPTT